jgi:prepilin peptidase CpaA
MELSSTAALVFAVFVLPICFYVCWSDLRAMRIPNGAVLLLAGVFIVIGPLVMPLETYGWRLLQLAIVLLVGIVANAGGLLGAGDAKFAAAAAPFVAGGDLRFVLGLFAACLLGAVVSHRLVKLTPLRRLAPDWQSWDRGRDFPMGTARGGALAFYLLIAVFTGS